MIKHSTFNQEELIEICKLIYPNTEWRFCAKIDQNDNLHKDIKAEINLKKYKYLGGDDSIIIIEINEGKFIGLKFYYKGNLNGEIYDVYYIW
ncbi:hypothetical protein [Salibacter sp.]|uniref:hypothetical protein n=1 Tax=Salibacter sp. TaxID=2010995 RepID=UPI00286FE2DE|nr:hypothetical protein [Salibacter sp.]MDR9397721.1 hypothetical protein [Salibacter sp.]MDR9487248.1 hypothetical protein [Salibacter sp.]